MSPISASPLRIILKLTPNFTTLQVRARSDRWNRSILRRSIKHKPTPRTWTFLTGDHKEILKAVVHREVQPIDEPFEALKLDYYLRPRTTSKRVQFSNGEDEGKTQAGPERVNLFDGEGCISTEQLTGWPFSHEEKNKIIEHWLEASSSLLNSEISLSISRIGATGDELRISELETAAEFDELSLSSLLDRLVSAIEIVGKGPGNNHETKEIVVDVLRSPEMSSKFKALNLPIPLQRFDAAINHVQAEPKETQVTKAYNLARAEIEDGPSSVTPESFDGFSGYLIENSDFGISVQLNRFCIANLDKLPIRRVGFVTAVEVYDDWSDSSCSVKEIKIPMKVTFADETTIIGDVNSWNEHEHDLASLLSTEIVKQAKTLSRASSNVVKGIEHNQKHLFGVDIPTRMVNLDQQFSSKATAKAARRGGMLISHQFMPLAMDKALDTPFNIGLDGFISAPLPSITLLPAPERREIHGRFSRIEWNRDWELEKEKYYRRKALGSLEGLEDVLAKFKEMI